MKVTPIDHMGTDLTTVNAARVSFDKESWWNEVYEDNGSYYAVQVNELKDEDKKLIKYLGEHEHYSPFGHSFASFRVKAPTFVARQLVKHKFLRWNEVSRRYVDTPPEFYHPTSWRGKAKDKKQGSEGEVDLDFGPLTNIEEACLGEYNYLLSKGVAPEQARMVLPLNTYTEWWWSGSLDAFASMCNLRLKKDSQEETRFIAKEIDKSMSVWYPESWRALVGRGV